MHPSPVLRSLSMIAVLSLGPRPLAAQGRTFPIQSSQSPSADQPDQADVPVTIEHLSAIVVSSVDGTPIPRALVISNDQRFAAFTDSQGRVSFDFRRAGAPGSGQIFSGYPTGPVSSPATFFLTLTARKPGYVQNTISFPLSTVQPDSPEPPFTVKLVPTGVITGHIYSDSGDLPEGLTVQILRKSVNNGRASWNGVVMLPSSTGEFRFANLDPGDYKLLLPAYLPDGNASSSAASASGVLPGFYPGGTDEDSAATLAVAPGGTVNANLTLHPAPFYEVTIPIAGTAAKQNLQAFILNTPPGLHLIPSSQSVTGHLPDGAYEVLLFSAEPRNTNDPNPQISDALVKIEVHGKAVLTPLAALHPVPEIPVTIQKELTSGKPQPNRPANQPSVFVMIENVRQDLNHPVPSMKMNAGDEGLALVGAMSGAYNVNVSPNGNDGTYVASATSGTTDLLREPLDIVPNSVPRPIEITLRDDPASIDATLTLDPAMPPPSPASQVILMCIPLERPESMPGFALARQTQVTVPNLPPGRYLLLAGQGLFLTRLEYTNPDVLSSLMQKGMVITLSPNQKATVQVPVMPDGGN